MAGDRPDLLAEVAGVSLGSSEGKVPEYRAQARAIAELYRAAATAVFGRRPPVRLPGPRRSRLRLRPIPLPGSRPQCRQGGKVSGICHLH